MTVLRVVDLDYPPPVRATVSDPIERLVDVERCLPPRASYPTDSSVSARYRPITA